MGNEPILSGLPTDVQSAVDNATQPDSGNDYSGAQRGPVTPGTNMPLPPDLATRNAAQPVDAAPDVAPYSPGSLADKLASAYLTHIAAQQPPPVNPAPDRSTAQRVGAGLSALGKGLGDMRTGDPHGGWLSAVGQTLNARTQRKDAEAQQEFQNAEEKRKNDALLARSQAETIALHRNFYQQDEQHRQQFHEGNKNFFSPYRESNDIQDDVNQEELYDRIKKDPNFTQNYLARATNEIPVVDGNGNEVLDKTTGLPVMKPMYSIMRIATKDGSPATATVDASKAADYAKYAGTNFPVGTKLTVLQDNMLNNRMAGVRDAASILGKANGKALDNDQLAALRPALSDPHVQFTLAHVPGDAVASINNGLSDADAMIQQAQQAQQVILKAQAAAKAAGTQLPPDQQQALEKSQSDIASLQDLKTKLTQIQNQGLNDHATDDYDKRHGDINNRLLEMEKGLSLIKSPEEAAALAAQSQTMAKRGLTLEQQQRLQQINQQATAAQNAITQVKNKTDEQSNLTGDDYLQTLPQQQQSTVRAVGEGRQALPANRKEALALLEQVHQAYPDFDESKVKSWQKANNEYRGSGKTATLVIPSYNTALEHMADLYGNTTAEGIFNPLSKAYNDRQVALGYVAREVGKAVSAGVMTQKESEELLSTLSGGLTPELKRERITKTAQLLHDKIDEYQTKFQEAAPSSAVKVPLLISPKAAQSYDVVTGKAQPPQSQAAPQQAQQPQIPAGARAARDGKRNIVGYVLNGKYVALGAQ